jgi:hypothetical protein
MSYPVRYRIKARQGDTYIRTLVWKIDEADDGNYEPVDLTGYSARMQVRPTASSKTVLLDCTDFINIGGGDQDPENGQIQLVIPAAALETVKPSPKEGYAYDLELVNGDVVTTIIAGPFNVAEEVTRDQ